MAVELDIFVGNTTIMDEEVYQLWLDGYTGRGVNLVPLNPRSDCSFTRFYDIEGKISIYSTFRRQKFQQCNRKCDC